MKAHIQEVVGSNPAVYWMDVSNASYYIHKNNKNKGSRLGHTKIFFLLPLIFVEKVNMIFFQS
jgi:hypothetical protein